MIVAPEWSAPLTDREKDHFRSVFFSYQGGQMQSRRGKSKTAHATVYFGSAVNNEGDRQICVHAECQLSGNRCGPVWGHDDPSVRRALATLTKYCDCPARFHKARDYVGKRVIPKMSRR